MVGQQGAEVDVEQLVAVQREHVTLLAPERCGETQATAAAERLRFPHRLDLGAEADECVDEDVLVARAAGDDHTRDPGFDEARDRVLGERVAGDRDERLRVALRRLAQPLRLATGEEQRLHQRGSSAGLAAAAGVAGEAYLGRPMPS